MRIAVCGKGGAGKSTLSWLLTRHAAESGRVLAIDADYNMDLAHNLGWRDEEGAAFISHAERDFYDYQGLTDKDFYVDLPAKENLRPFTFDPSDNFTQKLTRAAGDNISLMIAGPTHENLLYGHRCSHAYVSSLKYYLPLLQTKRPVIVDSVAGTDMVSYGMYLGVDAVTVVVEPTVNSMGVFRQISAITREFGIPVFAILNKVSAERPVSETFLAQHGGVVLGQVPADVSLMQVDWAQVSSSARDAVAGIWRALEEKEFDSAQRWQRHIRWRERYEQQLEASKKDTYNFVA